jgi:hypothetical protein
LSWPTLVTYSDSRALSSRSSGASFAGARASASAPALGLGSRMLAADAHRNLSRRLQRYAFIDLHMQNVTASHLGLRESPIEKLARQAGTDKMRSQHKYTDTYAMLFDAIRLSVTNVTEVGIFKGQSLELWLRYFPHATVWGLDTQPFLNSRELSPRLTRAEHHRLRRRRCCRDRRAFDRIGFTAESMDLVIEDTTHEWEDSEWLFGLFFPLVKPGGYYVIEDVDPQRGGDNVTQQHSSLSPALRDALEQHHAFYADTTVGIPPRRWAVWAKKMGPAPGRPGDPGWVKNRAVHNSHLLVIRKRLRLASV